MCAPPRDSSRDRRVVATKNIKEVIIGAGNKFSAPNFFLEKERKCARIGFHK